MVKIMREVHSPVDVPSGHHFAIIVFKTQSVFHEGDERSRTSPGHGYPAHTEHIPTFRYFATEDMKEATTKLEALYRENAQRKDILFQEVNRKLEVYSTVSIHLDVR